MERKIGVIAIIVNRDKQSGVAVQQLLSEFQDLIIGRMGIPTQNHTSAISVIVRGDNARISALAGKLGKLDSVSVKTAVLSAEDE